MELKINCWKEFKVSNIFKKVKVNKLSSIPKTNGDIPFISSQSTNNGIVKYCKVDKKFILQDAITVSTNGSNFDCFYHNYKFVASTDVEILFCDNLTSNIALFICTILKKNQRKYSFGNKAKNNAVFNTNIKLPIDLNGNIDWQFMEEYIKYLLERERESSELIQPFTEGQIKLNITQWKEFKIGEVLKRVKISSISSIKRELKKGEINIIGNSRINNGIIGKADITDKNYIHDSNYLSYGAKGGYFFYQEEKWVSTDHVHMFSIKCLNKYIALFLCSIINKLIDKKGGWASSLESNIIDESIKLPVDANNNPDWDFMEQYIKSLPYSKYL